MIRTTPPGLSKERPFAGLRPFDYADREYFFGRQSQVYSLYRLLDRSHFIAVIGSSGSGKSSLVRAGLLPLLDASWATATLRPGGAPLQELSDAIVELASRTETPQTQGDPDVRRELIQFAIGRSSVGLSEALLRVPTIANKKILVIVDQFEELFRYAAASRNEAGQFVQILLEASRSQAYDVRILITMRSEFIGHCAQFQNLPEAVSASQFLVPSLTRDQREEVIRKPIEKAAGTIDSDLVEQLLNDVGNEMEQLPVLQHCLMRLWDLAGPAHHLDEALYRSDAIAGIQNALSRHGNTIYDALPEHLRKVCCRLFKALTDPSGVRNPLTVRAACEVTQASFDDVVEVAHRFRAESVSFLTPAGSAPLKPDDVLDLAHESVMRVWDKLVRWVQEEAQSAQVYTRLVYLATQVWSNKNLESSYRPVRAGRADPSLLAGTELAIVRFWREENRPTPAWGQRYSKPGAFETAMRYLDCSIEARRIEAERRLRTGLIIKATFGTIIGVATAFLVLGLIAVRSNSTAMLLLSFAAVGLVSASAGVVLGRRIPLAAGIGAVLFGAAVYAYAISACIDFISHNLTPSLVADSTFRQFVVLLPPRARLPILIGAIGDIDEQYNAAVSVDRLVWNEAVFTGVDRYADFLQYLNGRSNGHSLFFRAQAQVVVHKTDSPVWRLDHTSIYDPWSTYVRNVDLHASYRDLRECWRIAGYCRERAGWILYVLAYVNWQAFLDPKPHTPDGKTLVVDAAQRLRYLQTAREDLAESVAYYPPCAWVYEPPPADMMNEIVSKLRALRALPEGWRAPPIHCAEPRHDPFIDYVRAY